MIRPRSTCDAYQGFHRHPADKQHTLEVFYKHRKGKRITESAGWYWRPSPYDELTQDEHGPFTSSRAAYRHACTVEK